MWCFRRFIQTAASTNQTITNAPLLKPSSFTGKAQFYEALFFLDDVYLKVKDAIVQQSSSSATSPSSNTLNWLWLSRERLQDKLGFPMSLLEYRQIRQRLIRIAPAAQASENILDLLRVFGQDQHPLPKKGTVQNVDGTLVSSTGDAFGRVTAIGRRKSSVAKVTIIPGTGECLVNGRPLIDYFSRFRDIYQVSRPLAVTQQFGKFNIWALARGGGQTGQTGAIKLALAKALATYNPQWKAVLDEAGLLKRDIRRVERKKPGQEKARKKFTWVKR